MLNTNLYQFSSSHKMTKVEVCLAASLGKQPRQNKGCLPSDLIVTCSVDLSWNGEWSPGLTDTEPWARNQNVPPQRFHHGYRHSKPCGLSVLLSAQCRRQDTEVSSRRRLKAQLSMKLPVCGLCPSFRLCDLVALLLHGCSGVLIGVGLSLCPASITTRPPDPTWLLLDT